MTSNSQMEMLSLIYNPVAKTIGFGLSNHHNSQTLRRRIGNGQQYMDIFHNIDPPPPSFDNKAQHTQQNMEELIDTRFYIAMRAPSGYCWKVETVLGPKLVSIHREVAPFPTLAEIVRFQIHKNLELDPYSKVQENHFGSNRYDFLQNILYPEITSQFDLLVTKLKLSTQLTIASREQRYRETYTTTTHGQPPTTSTHPPPPKSSFSEMDDATLSTWISDTTKIVTERKLKLSPTAPNLTSLCPSDYFTVPANYRNGFRYSFIRYADCQTALPTAQLILRAKKFRKNSKFLSACVKLARCSPHLVLPVQAPNDFQIDNLQCLKSLMYFLSYGFYDVSKQTK